jgi:hypothetical protein
VCRSLSRPALKAAERKRLREVWRSAGWPWQDALELELVAAGLLERVHDSEGRAAVRLSPAGVAALAAATGQHRQALAPHEALVRRVAQHLAAEGRIAWRGLSLRAPLPMEGAAASTPSSARHGLWPEQAEPATPAVAPMRWVMAMPDVFSIRVSTLATALDPVVHEIKVRRADLLSDLRHADKGAAYRALAGRCVYVLAEGIAEPDEVPADYGVMLARGPAFEHLELLRSAPHHGGPQLPAGLPLATWLALARATPETTEGDPAQEPLKPA